MTTPTPPKSLLLPALVFGGLAYFVWLKFWRKNRTEVDDSFDEVKEGQLRSSTATLDSVMRTPPVAMTGLQPLTTTNVNPFSGIGDVGIGQFLPKYASGTVSGSTVEDSGVQPAEDLAGFNVPRNWLVN